MKFMGSKRAMLLNGLGETIAREVPEHRRFVDLFTGSGAVAWHVAQNFAVPVLANDLQQFSVSLAEAVLTRTEAAQGDWIAAWLKRSVDAAHLHKSFLRAKRIQERLATCAIKTVAREARVLSAESSGAVIAAYGGYYYSPLQALYIDALRANLPRRRDYAKVALAALIQTASRCSASPGHTAQPFKPNATAGPFVVEAWSRDVLKLAQEATRALAPLHALVEGAVSRCDAGERAKILRSGDLVFLDPPYSGVHYSRFYHVLETLSIGAEVIVTGTGRYPPADERPRSDYSIATKSEAALTDLLGALSERGCSVILTFPAGSASNGLSGESVRRVAKQFYRIKSAKVSSRFSTLGGNLSNRDARQNAEELILTLKV